MSTTPWRISCAASGRPRARPRRCLALAPTEQKNRALARRGSGAARAARRRSWRPTTTTCARPRRTGTAAAHCSIGCGSMRRASRPWRAASTTSQRLRRSHRHGAWRMVAAERPAHRARVRAVGRDRHHLREPPERHRGCGRAVPEIGQCRDPARRLGERAIQRGDSCLPGGGAGGRGSAATRAFNWCPPPTARPSATCWPT